MKLKQLLQGVATGSEAPDIEIAGLTSDSRKVQKGFVFIAVPGTKADGHDFAEKAVELGAAAVVAERALPLTVPVVLVKDAREAYALMAGNFFGNPAEKLNLIGVTGTNGKTSTTFIFKHVLEQLGHKVGLIGTIVNMVGEESEDADNTTPDAMELQALFARMVKAGCDWCVMEVSSHALDQHRVAGLKFKCGIFTNLTQDHLDYHKTMENYRLAKQKLFDVCELGVFNFDDEASAVMMQEAKTEKNVTFSTVSDFADFTARNIRLFADHVEYQVVSKGCLNRVNVAMPGGFNVRNTLGVIAACVGLGIPQADAVAAVKTCKGVKGRIEVVPTDTPYTVILDYAHTPDALINIGRAIRDFATGRIITVYGCGGDRDRTKRPLMTKAVIDFSDYFVLTSDNPRTEDPQRILDDAAAGIGDSKVPHAILVDRTQAIAHALSLAKENDIVLIAGKGHETYQILSTGKIHYDEREVVTELLEKQKQGK